MLGDTAVAVNPDDERYADAVGKTILLPILNREIPVVADEGVEHEFGTGAVKVTPAHDPLDFEIGLRHGLEPIKVIDTEAKITKAGGEYFGMDRFEAREPFVDIPGPPNALLRNVGGCRFECAEDVAAAEPYYQTLAAAWSDIDLDGDQDLYVVNEGGPNQLVRNDDGGRFVDITDSTRRGTSDSAWASRSATTTTTEGRTSSTSPTCTARRGSGSPSEHEARRTGS